MRMVERRGGVRNRRRAAVATCAALLASTLLIAAPRAAKASSVCSIYDYAMQFTAPAAGYYNPSTKCFNQITRYYGWVGIDGQITTPSGFPYLGDSTAQTTAWDFL